MLCNKKFFQGAVFGLLSLAIVANVGAELGTLRVNTYNGWLAFEIITVGDDPAGDGYGWSMPGTFDGIGAVEADGDTLRVLVNHETSDATISEVELDSANLAAAIEATINGGNEGGISFLNSARQAYDRWTDDGGSSWTATSGTDNTAFQRFCSSQSYVANLFGPGRGFADELYVTGEEVSGGILLAVDLANRDFYRLSGVSGSAGAGIGGMPFDAWENAALIDTGETNHIALLLSPDGGSQIMQLYIGEKGKDANGNSSNEFLARNGLHYGSFYYLNDSLPGSGTSTNGFFDTTTADALSSSKLEDVDTSPVDPVQVVLGDQNSGLFVFDFALDFSSGSFDAGSSGFSITKIQNHNNDTDNAFGDADNVEWTAATTLGGVEYPDGLIFVNEDSGTGNGEIWMMRPDGSDLLKIGDTSGISGSTETTGIVDISALLGYVPGSILLTNNQGSNSSLSLLINPNAALGDTDSDGVDDGADNCTLTGNPGQRDTDGDGFGNHCDADLNDDCIVNALDLGLLKLVFFSTDADSDLNGDGVVNAIDLGIFKTSFFLPPGPSGLPNACNGG